MKSLLVASFAVGLVALAVVPADAQLPRPERPYRGLFGGGTGNWDQSLVANLSIGGGWDDNLLADARGRAGAGGRPSDLDRSFRGSVAQATGSLQYSLSRDRLSVAATAATSGRYYPSLRDDVIRRDTASLSAGLRITQGLSASAGVAYMPFSLASMFVAPLEPGLDELSVPEEDLVLSDEYLVAYNAGLNFQHQVSRRTTVSANYQYRARQSSGRSRQFERHGVGGRVTYAVGRGLNVRAGYGYSEAYYSTTGITRRNHLIDAGAGYNRALSISRRTTLSFGTGTTATTRPEADVNRTRFRLTGNVGLNHEIGRTWNAGIAYSRGVRLDENWPEPVLSDAVTAYFGGLFSRRLSFQSSARASTGRIGFENRSGFNSYRGGASLNFALSRYAGLGVAYSYYYHRFQEGVALLPGLPAGIDRHSVRAYANVWAPLFQRSRRSNAAR